jgi:hypothetical protein
VAVVLVQRRVVDFDFLDVVWEDSIVASADAGFD